MRQVGSGPDEEKLPFLWPNGDGSGSRSKIVAYSETFRHYGQEMCTKTVYEKDAKDAEGQARFELRKSHRLELRIADTTSVRQAILSLGAKTLPSSWRRDSSSNPAIPQRESKERPIHRIDIDSRPGTLDTSP